MRSKRLEELDIMKFWGILLVVLGHVTNMYTPYGLVQPLVSSAAVQFISNFVYLFHMPLFVFVSGCVYAYQSEVQNSNQTFIGLLKKKSIRLLIPYLFFGVMMIVLMNVCGFRNDIFDYTLNGIILSKDSRHLWFVLMLFEVFMIFYVMNKCVDKLKLPKWSMLLISFVFYMLAKHFPYVFQISNAFRYLFWFTFGFVFFIYKLAIRNIIVNYVIVGSFLLSCAFVKFGCSGNIPFMSTIAAIGGIMLFYTISCDFRGITKYKIYQLISKNSFGIYLYHVFFIYLMFFYLANISISPYLLISIVFVVSLALSIAMTELTRKIGWNVIIGEKRIHAE